MSHTASVRHLEFKNLNFDAFYHCHSLIQCTKFHHNGAIYICRRDITILILSPVRHLGFAMTAYYASGNRFSWSQTDRHHRYLKPILPTT